jgi:charged multivesicular body protein 3
MSAVLNYFRKAPDPKDLVRKWQSELRSEQRGLERQIRDLQREEKLAQKNVRRRESKGRRESGSDWLFSFDRHAMLG